MDWLKRWYDDDGYHIDFINAKPTKKPLLEVSNRVINEIANKYPGPYYLMVSGGVDSQTMLWCWQNSDIPFIPISVRYLDHNNNTVNDHDLAQLEEYASQFDLKITYKYFEIQKFLESSMIRYAKRYCCTSPQITTHMAISELVTDGTVIFSGNFIGHAYYSYTIMGLDRYAALSKRNIIPFFLLHDPELAANLVQFKKVRSTKKSMAYALKIDMLREAGVPVKPQPEKLTGFEVVKDIYQTYDDIVSFRERVKYSKYPGKSKFDVYFRYRLTEKIKYIDKINYHNRPK